MPKFNHAQTGEPEHTVPGWQTGVFYEGYESDMTRLLEDHMGTDNVYLGYQKTQKLASYIQPAYPMQPEEFVKLDKQVAGDKDYQLTERQEVISLAREAVKVLVECNMRLAKNRADMSVGIGRRGRAFYTTFTDIRQLKSKDASYADRVQAANAGLVTASWKYKPGMIDEKTGNPLNFVTFASTHIDNALYRWTMEQEFRFVRMPTAAKKQLQEAEKNIEEADQDTRKTIAMFHAIQESVSFEEISPDEITESSIEHDPTAEAVITAMAPEMCEALMVRSPERHKAIAKIFLATNMSAALTGEHFGISRERVRTIMQAVKTNMEKEYASSEKLSPKQDTHDTRLTNFGRNTILANADLFSGLIDSRDLMQSRFSERAAAFVMRTRAEGLRARHVEQIWNDSFNEIAEKLQRQGQEFSLKRFTQVLSLLLGNTIQADEIVRLRIPKQYSGKLDYVAAWTKQGTVIVEGNVRNFVGAYSEPQSRIIVDGFAVKQPGIGTRDAKTVEVRRIPHSLLD